MSRASAQQQEDCDDCGRPVAYCACGADWCRACGDLIVAGEAIYCDDCWPSVLCVYCERAHDKCECE